MRLRLKIPALGLLLLVLVLPVLLFFPPSALLKMAAAANPEVLFFVDTDRPAVALTFDDGPDARVTPRVLDLLAEYDASATFFLIGDHVSGNEELMSRMRAEGHELGNHLEHDEASIGLSPSAFERQLEFTDSLLTAVAPEPADAGKWIRPGSGWFNRRMLEQSAAMGYRLALGSVYPHDLLLKSPELISEFILGRARAGSVLILHDGDGDPDRTVEVLRRVLPALKARGFEMLTLSELTALKRSQLKRPRPRS